MLDTDQLRSFLAIVDTGSFTRAAERVNKTQSAVSMHVRRLEEQLGCALFVKQGRGARLSEEGEKLIDFARRMMQIEAGAMAALSRKGLSGRVRLGIPDDYTEFFLADILTRFCQRHPLVETSVVCDASMSLAPAVRARALDLAVVTDTEGMQDVEVIREDRLVWVASKRFQHAPDAPLPLALSSTICVWRKVAEEALRNCNRATRPLLASNNYSAIAPVVRAGLAVTILPLGTVPADLRVLGPEFGLPHLPTSRMGLIRAPGHQSHEAAALADAIRATIGELKQAAAA
ncbi:LysR family transcriptional regulator [Methylocapsa sp. S129]|uniref:LysR family transcriptional regulator n=1 Tax=Methylocapsa sp. S129 TaxID=1641869 RepID=UPI00131AA405|nr:LysR family transcriptional regulator [Methylocapsa sp. S129]